jgi:hypothetical protein
MRIQPFADLGVSVAKIQASSPIVVTCWIINQVTTGPSLVHCHYEETVIDAFHQLINSSHVFAGPGLDMSLAFFMILYLVAPFHSLLQFIQLFIDMLRTRRYIVPPCFDTLVSAGQRQTS